MQIVLFSSGSLSLKLIPYLFQNSSKLILVTKPDKPQDRHLKVKPNIVKQTFLENSTKFSKDTTIFEFESLKKIEQKEKLDELKRILKETDIAICCDVGLIIPESFIDLPKIFINIHPSLLPLYRGPSPIQYTLLNDEKITGITICLLSKEVDKGDIILQKIIKIEEDDNFVTLKEKLSQLALTSFTTFLDLYKNNSINFYKQDDEKATFTLKIKDTSIDLSKGPIFIHNQVRAYFPDAYITFKNKRIKILKTKIVERSELNLDLKENDLFLFSKNRLFFRGFTNKLAEILELQVEGKKPINSISFINGYLKNV